MALSPSALLGQVWRGRGGGEMSCWHCSEPNALLRKQTERVMALLSTDMVFLSSMLLKRAGSMFYSIAKISSVLSIAHFLLGHLGVSKPGRGGFPCGAQRQGSLDAAI